MRAAPLSTYDFFSDETVRRDSGDRRLIVDASVEPVRPYSIGFAVKGRVVSETILEALIQSQEKLCNNFGRKRKSIAMGVYRSDLISYPGSLSGSRPAGDEVRPSWCRRGDESCRDRQEASEGAGVRSYRLLLTSISLPS